MLKIKYILTILLITFLFSSCGSRSGMIEFPEPDRLSGQTDVLELACEPIDTVDIAIIGLESNGVDAVHRLSKIEGVRIRAIFDLAPKILSKAQSVLAETGLPAAEVFSHEEDWRTICERDDIDLVYIFAPDNLRTQIAVYAMDNGKHVATVSPAALTLHDCWELVNTAEKNRRHMIMFDDRCYYPFEMAVLNMTQLGYYGNVVKVESGDISQSDGIGPVAQILNIHRGDKMNFLMSVSGTGNTIIRTQMGKTILLRSDSITNFSSDKIYNIRGTKASLNRNHLGDISVGDSVLIEYEHPLLKEIGNMEYIMDYRLIYCLRNGLPLDLDVYDAAEWSALVPLSKVSAEHNGRPVKFPDFTRQSWDKIKGYKQYKNGK
jgi:hypothetical protein